MAEDWIGVQEAADLLGVTRQMVHKLIKSKRLSAKPLSAGGALILSRREVVGYPTKRVLALAGKVAKGGPGELRAMADLTALLTRMPGHAITEFANKIRWVADREKRQDVGSVADRYRSVADAIEALVP